MALTVDKLINDDRFCGENVLQFILYLPFGIILLAVRVILALILWIASIILPNNQAVRQLLSSLACWTFGVYVKLKGSRDPRCSVMVSNCVSCLDSLAVSHVLGTISLKKWKLPPFFASTLGIRNAAQFVRKQHFTDSPSKPVLLQPEGGPTNGKGLLRFTDWPFQIGNRVQPMTITVERPFTQVTVNATNGRGGRDAFPWADALWFLCTPATVFRVRLLPALERRDEPDAAFARRIRQAIADALGLWCPGGDDGVQMGGAECGQCPAAAALAGRAGAAGAAGEGRAARRAHARHPARPGGDAQRGRDDHELPGGRDAVRGRAARRAALRHARAHGGLPAQRQGAPAQLPGAESPDDCGSETEIHREARTRFGARLLEILSYITYN